MSSIQAKRSFPKQFAIEWVFLVCRVILTYAAVLVFLALPPVVRFNQVVAGVLGEVIPSLAVMELLPDSTRREATSQAMSLVWLGRASASLFTTAEQQHLLDVHWLFVSGGVIVGLVISCAVLIEMHTVRLWVAGMYRKIALGVALFSFSGIFFFEPIFMLFHVVFFPQGNYAFPVDSVIIQTFPPVFWLLNFVLLQAGVVISLYLQARHAETVGI